MSKSFGNSRTKKFLVDLELLVSLDSDECNLSNRCKFNFSYFDANQEFSGKLDDWDINTIVGFFDKLIDFGNKSLDELQQVRIGRNRRGMLGVYDSFPAKSKFDKPKNIPHQVQWARIRLDQNKRLVGFVLPKDYDGIKHPKTGRLYDANTFYVVFIDNDHNFYPLS